MQILVKIYTKPNVLFCSKPQFSHEQHFNLLNVCLYINSWTEKNTRVTLQVFVDRLRYNSHHYPESCLRTKLKKLPAGKVFHLRSNIRVGKLIAWEGEDRWPYCLCGLCLFQQSWWSLPWQQSLMGCCIETPHFGKPNISNRKQGHVDSSLLFFYVWRQFLHFKGQIVSNTIFSPVWALEIISSYLQTRREKSYWNEKSILGSFHVSLIHHHSQTENQN